MSTVHSPIILVVGTQEFVGNLNDHLRENGWCFYNQDSIPLSDATCGKTRLEVSYNIGAQVCK